MKHLTGLSLILMLCLILSLATFSVSGFFGGSVICTAICLCALYVERKPHTAHTNGIIAGALTVGCVCVFVLAINAVDAQSATRTGGTGLRIEEGGAAE